MVFFLALPSLCKASVELDDGVRAHQGRVGVRRVARLHRDADAVLHQVVLVAPGACARHRVQALRARGEHPGEARARASVGSRGVEIGFYDNSGARRDVRQQDGREGDLPVREAASRVFYPRHERVGAGRALWAHLGVAVEQDVRAHLLVAAAMVIKVAELLGRVAVVVVGLEVVGARSEGANLPGDPWLAPFLRKEFESQGEPP